MSRPSHLPYPPGYQMYSFSCDDGTDIAIFHVFFEYGQDEETLDIYRVFYVPYAGVVDF